MLSAGNYSNPLIVNGCEYQVSEPVISHDREIELKRTLSQPTANQSSVVATSSPPLADELGGLYAFQAMAAAGTLPAVSYIIGPAALSEHAPYLPRDGAWVSATLAYSVWTEADRRRG